MTLEQLETALPIYQDYKQAKAKLESTLRSITQYDLGPRSTNLKLRDFTSDRKFFEARQKEYAERLAAHERYIKDTEALLKQVEENVIKDLAKI